MDGAPARGTRWLKQAGVSLFVALVCLVAVLLVLAEWLFTEQSRRHQFR